MASEPEDAIESAILRARQDPIARPAFYRLLMSEMLFVCGQVRRAAATDPALPPQPGDQLSLAVVRHNGRSYHPVFSSLARLVGFAGKDVPYFSMAGRELFRCTPNVDFALNPNSPFGKELTAREIAFWLDPSARARRTLANNPPRAILSAPDACPRQLTDAFRILFANRSDVVAAHLLYVAFTDRDEPAHPLIGIRTEGEWPKLAAEVSELAAAILPDTIIDLVRLGEASDRPGLPAELEKTAPFYVREILLAAGGASA